MAENTKIEWADHTFNPWVGCTKVSPACDHCYAEGWAKRTGQPQLWQGERRRTSEANWRLPLKWNRQAERDGTRPRVFCASLADVFDNQVPYDWRAELWRLIAATPHLDWLLLTKRAQNIAKMLPEALDMPRGFSWPLPNVWLGTTVENQAEADRRIPHLLSVPAAVHFLSCEPLLGPVDLRAIYKNETMIDPFEGMTESPVFDLGDRFVAVNPRYRRTGKLDWIIAGGESGPDARPPDLDWFRSLRDQCAEAGVPFFFKQWGEWQPGDGDTPYGQQYYRVGKKKAGRLLDGREHNEVPR